MTTKRSSAVISACAATLCVSALGLVGGAQAGAPPGETPSAVPAGVTLVDVSKGGDEISNGFLWRRLGDANGDPLYTYDRDGNGGHASCVDACAQEFPPFLAEADAVASGDWSLVSRPDASGRQWAYRGRPLYRYAGHARMPQLALEFDSVVGKGQEHDFEPSSKYFAPKVGWRQAVFDPEHFVATPADIRLECLETANGYAFVAAPAGLPLYLLESEPQDDTRWTPFYASSLALPVGEFTIVRRSDGTHQWAYRGGRLYTYSGDYSSSDINGVTQHGARIALAYRFEIPSELAIKVLPTRPPMMTTAAGLTVYTEARYHLQYGGRETRGGYHYSYDEARAVGARGCVSECTRTWRPVLAAKDARGRGLWTVLTRPDGSRQWAYKGSALYTYAGDRNPGDIKGNNKAVILYGDARDRIVTVLGEGFSGREPEANANDLMSLAGGKDFDSHSYYGAPFGAGFYWHLVPLFN